MSRREPSQDGSLDLLLDTICNTFGGVLFISMLVVVLLNMTSSQVAVEPPSPKAQDELVEWQRRLTDSEEEVERLRTALRDQERIERLVLEPGLEELVKRLEASQATRAALLKDKNARLDDIGKSQIEINTIAQQLEDLDKALAQANAELDSLKRELAREIEKRTRAARLPAPRATTKTEVPFFLRQGRFCAYAKRDADGGLVPNHAEFEEKQDSAGKTYVEPRVEAGTPVDPTGANRGTLANRLDAFDPGKHYLAVFVWPDSFEHFAVIRDLMVEKRFEYRLVPFPENEKIYVGGLEGEVIVF